MNFKLLEHHELLRQSVRDFARTQVAPHAQAWDKAEHVTKQWIATVQDHIDLGTWTEDALIGPLRSYANARVQHLTALMDYNLAMSNLALVSGWDSAAPHGS